MKRLIYLYRKKNSDDTFLILLISFITFYGMFLGRWVYDDIPYNIFLALTVNTILDKQSRIKVLKWV